MIIIYNWCLHLQINLCPQSRCPVACTVDRTSAIYHRVIQTSDSEDYAALVNRLIDCIEFNANLHSTRPDLRTHTGPTCAHREHRHVGTMTALDANGPRAPMIHQRQDGNLIRRLFMAIIIMNHSQSFRSFHNAIHLRLQRLIYWKGKEKYRIVSSLSEIHLWVFTHA